MNKYEKLQVQVLPSGVLRIYGDSGLVFEAQASYIHSETFLSAKQPSPSGEVTIGLRSSN